MGEPEPPAADSAGIRADEFLEQVRQLALELHPQSPGALRVTLDSALERDLGLDSLARAELLLRLERRLGASLPEQALATAETAGDLWRALRLVDAGTASARVRVAPVPAALDEVEGVPHAATTLLEVLEWHVQLHPQRLHVYLYGDAEQHEEIAYATLADGARALAAGLQSRGLLPGQSVAIMLPTGRDYLSSFFAILMAGAVPVPIYPPLRPSQLEDHLRRHAGILANAGAVLLITPPQARGVARLLKSQVETLQHVVTPSELAASDSPYSQPVVRGGDTAFLQYTSGSTGAPKGVILTHANLLANIRAMGAAVQADSHDVFVSWLPLYHDMGLIGAWLGSLYFGMPLVLLSPLAFLARPQRWLWAIHRHRGTLTAAPNFAYELCLSRLDGADLDGLDLSSLRRAFNGAEPVSPNTVRRFTAGFGSYGLSPQALAPVYGLAEAAVGLAFPPPGRGPLIERIRREPFESMGKALPAEASESNPLEFVACGQPLPGYQVRIVDAAGHELPERRQGRLEFQGPSATSGYLHNEEATRRLIDGAWRDTGDLAYVAAGDVYLTGRVKDIIIRGGRNIHPYEVEEAVGDIAGVRKGCVAVFGSTDPAAGTERVIVVAETRETDQSRRANLQAQVSEVASEVLGMPPDEVVLAPPHTVLKTSSGKIRRAAVRELLEKGRLGEQPRAVWWQLARLALASARPVVRSTWRRLIDIAYAGYVKGIFWLLAPPTWLVIALLPVERWRWAVMRNNARLLFRLSGVRLAVEGLGHWPTDRACVIVANHASYLDGVVLVAALPGRFSFIAKQELHAQFIPRVFLQRIGTLFVERFDMQRGLSDLRRGIAVLQSGRALLFFPEGTFTRMPGLRAFHMGAFVAAAESNVPVLPVTIRGTRSILRGDARFPHHGALHVSIGEPILPDGAEWAAALRLRDAARAALLVHLEEPDLAQGTPT
ncbi:MAG: AMP-binding protein [Chromatiaceae bacterium]|nr:AMP-binding protein [Chromatiaceae bacterium]